MPRFDTVIRGGHVLIESSTDPVTASIGISDGRVVAICEDIPASQADEVIDARGKLVLPGAVDSHVHLGIYRSVSEDVESETVSAAVGGTTSVLSYFRTGHHYLDRSGPYREIFPEVLRASAGQAHVDFGYHLAPMTNTHIDEMEWLVTDMGVTSFKFFWSYVGAQMDPESESYDGGFAYRLMERVAELNRRHGHAGRISLSVHCEDAELIALFQGRAESAGPRPLDQYSTSRPALGEALSVHKTALMSAATGAPVNLLHLSSHEAAAALTEARGLRPAADLRGETAAHYLLLSDATGMSAHAKVNPPVRHGADAEALWSAIGDGRIDWIGSDHCCAMAEHKGGTVWDAVPGFGGAALMLPVLMSEGHLKRGLPVGRIVELVSRNPAKAFGCYGAKGRIGLGADADLVIFDRSVQRTVTPELLHSAQDHSPYAGLTVQGWPVRTLLRGHTVALDGQPVGQPVGRYLARPLQAEPPQIHGHEKGGLD